MEKERFDLRNKVEDALANIPEISATDNQGLLLESLYLKSMLQLIATGNRLPSRNGFIYTDGAITFRFSSSDDWDWVVGEPCWTIPATYSKRVVPTLAFKEMQWIMSGKNDKESLNNLGVKYWDPWFLNDGTIGRSYGYQIGQAWTENQVYKAARTLKEDPYSRRNIISMWNIRDLDHMALPPCFYNYQIKVVAELPHGIKMVDLVVTSRSCDSFIGLPYNFLSSWFLGMTVCAMASKMAEINDELFVLRDITWNIADYHLYEEHVPDVLQQARNLKLVADSLTDENVVTLKEMSPLYKNEDGFQGIADWLMSGDLPNSFKANPFSSYEPEIIKGAIKV